MLKVGLIGCGFMGTMHANCYQNIPGVSVTAFADLRREKAEALAAGTEAVIYEDGADLIAMADVDIIDICLPTYLHTAYALKAMEKVPYVFIEKPVALTAEECAALLAKQNATGCQVQVGQVIRFWDEYVELKRILDSGVFGPVINANFRRISPRPTWGWEDWLLDPVRSGGAAQDLHVHDIDFVLSLFGRPREFYSIKNTRGEKNSYVNTLMAYDDFAVTVEGTWDLPGSHPFEASFRVVCHEATLEYSGGKLLRYTDAGAEEIYIEKAQVTGDGFEGGNISDLGGYFNELLYFCRQAQSRSPIAQATLADGVSSLEFLLEEIRDKN